ncbi:MAG: metalloregulator ArsR/SmtB family transcription factor [Polyangiaceae bacterium]|nr:metalloregulator ArsR/SmtB family transcription factor [Polyangiaceae bacterium]
MKDAAQFFKVLAEEARIQMLWLLFNHEELCVCDFMAALEITQSKASRHLSALRHAALVADRKEGLWSYYALRRVEDPLARKHLDLLKATLANRADAKLLLAKLHKWLADKDRNVACPADAACGSPGISRTPSRARRASGKGALR